MTCQKQTLDCVVVSMPHIEKVFNKGSHQQVEHLVYDALINYRSKPREHHRILCSSLDYCEVDGVSRIEWHSGMGMYKHINHIPISNPHNCYGGFHQIPPIPIPKDDETYPAVCLLARQVPAVPKAQRPHRHPALPMAARTAHCAVQGA